MRIKIIGGLVIIIALLTGIAIFKGNDFVESPTETDSPTGISIKPLPVEGRVVADDESPGSPPKQVTISEPVASQPNYAQARPIQKRLERTVVINNKEYPIRTYQPLLVPNDPLASQWWVSNTKLDQAWDTPIGSRQTILAVIDTGFALNHDEFQNRWYINIGESGVASQENPSTRNCSDRGIALNASCNLIDDDADGNIDNETGSTTYQNPSRLNCTDQSKLIDRSCNRIDDDNNGHIDDVQGWDFINNDNSAQAGELNPSGTGTTHGTMVVGVAAATGNNGKGFAGADWAAKILPIQALDDDSYGDTLSVGRAIYYAADQDADVISLSLGSQLSDEYVQEAVQYAIAKGSVVVASSGNDGCDCIVYPANYPEVIAVGALDTASQRAGFSSWGANLDLLAPGTQITTSTWTASNPKSAYASNASGTSFAAPLISGLLTRILSHQPGVTPMQLMAALTENTNRLVIPYNVSKDAKLGFGTLDALKSTKRMTVPQDTALLYGFHPISKGDFIIPASEVVSSQSVHSCPDGIIGTTPIFELIKSNSHFFSISASESSAAAKTGYSSKLFSYACMQQPHDTSSFVRNINLFSEFRNIFRPLQ